MIFREGKLVYQLGNVASDDRRVYLGFQGMNSAIAVFNQEDMYFVGLYMPMCGSPNKIKLVHDLNKLICSTSAGCIYVWDTSIETIASLERVTLDPLTINGFVRPEIRVKPVLEILSEAVSDCVDVDHIPNTPIMVSVDSAGSLTFFDIEEGTMKGTVDRLKKEGNRVICMRVDPLPSTMDGKSGHWIALGGSNGFIGMLFVEVDKLVKQTDGFTAEHASNMHAVVNNTGDRADVNSVDFRTRVTNSTNTVVLAGCNDGAVRCSVFKMADEGMQLHKVACYQHCRPTVSGAVYRIIAERDSDGAPYVISLCNMQLPFDLHDTAFVDGKQGTGEPSSFCSEILMQKLMQEQSEQYAVLSHMREFITDAKFAPDQSYILFCTLDEVYIIIRDHDTKAWGKPLRLEWNTLENQKLMAKLL
ncbi:hypothetical protein BgAZ_402320 [Babesia gibsoni]|uniref:Uncharacterized protein n=1 Tax=Babesia gibsoni TaxID=33632 RepID=A0AAD8PDE5_BABGI|nr:hypothetical protein BgAZ_402320 [Babesia gibsoni]